MLPKLTLIRPGDASIGCDLANILHQQIRHVFGEYCV